MREYSAASSVYVCVACPAWSGAGLRLMSRLCFTVYIKESELLTRSILYASTPRVQKPDGVDYSSLGSLTDKHTSSITSSLVV